MRHSHMFISVGNIARLIGSCSAIVLLAAGRARIASVHEAMEAINRAIIQGDPRMELINSEFKRIYGKKK